MQRLIERLLGLDDQEFDFFGYGYGSITPSGVTESLYSFASGATDGSNYDPILDEDYPSLAVINRHYDVLEELTKVMNARRQAELEKKAKEAKEFKLAKKLSLFGDVTPAAKAAENVDTLSLLKIRVGFEFGQRDPVSFSRTM